MNVTRVRVSSTLYLHKITPTYWEVCVWDKQLARTLSTLSEGETCDRTPIIVNIVWFGVCVQIVGDTSKLSGYIVTRLVGKLKYF